MKLCEELLRRQVDICCLQKVRWRGMCSKFLGKLGERFNLWWSGNKNKKGGVGILVRKYLCRNLVEINKISDRVVVIMNKKNLWDRMVDVKVVEGSIEPFAMNEVEKDPEIMKNGKTSRPTRIVKKHLAVSPHRKQVVLQIANEILNRKDMPHDWKTSTVVPFIKKKGGMDCASYRGVKLLEHGMKVIERLREERLRRLV